MTIAERDHQPTEATWRERPIPEGTRFLILNPDGSTGMLRDLSDPTTVTADFDAVCRAERYKQPANEEQEAAAHLSLIKKHRIAEFVPGTERGFLTYGPRGLVLMDGIENLVREKYRANGRVSEVRTPSLLQTNHPALLKYLERFPAGQFRVGDEDFMPFAACFGQFLLMSQRELQEQNLPLGILEIVRAFRREIPDTLRGLERLQGFTMPDCHFFCKDMIQTSEHVLAQFILCQETMAALELEPQMAIRATEEFYRENPDLFMTLADAHQKPVLLEIWQQPPAYFCFKLELHCLDASQRRNIALSTVQIDPENAGRFGIVYSDSHGNKRHPIITHNSLSGSLERVLWGILEKKGREIKAGGIPEWPYWLAPVQVRLLPFAADQVGDCERLAQAFPARVEVDDRTEIKINKRVQAASQEWVPFTIVYGKREAGGEVLPVRNRQGEIVNFTLDEFAQHLKELQGDNPSLARRWPLLLSQQAL